MADWRQTSRLNFGYSRSRYWLKIPIFNSSSGDSDWLLEFGYPLIQIIHFHQFAGAKQVAGYETGRLLTFKSRPVSYRNFLFNFSVPKGIRSDLYIMIESVGTVLAPMAIYTRDAFLSQSVQKTAAIGVYCGIILAMVLFNLFQGGGYRQESARPGLHESLPRHGL